MLTNENSTRLTNRIWAFSSGSTTISDQKIKALQNINSGPVELSTSLFKVCMFSSFCISTSLSVHLLCFRGKLSRKSTGPPMRVRDKEGEPHRGTYLMLHAHTLTPVLPLRPLIGLVLALETRPDSSSFPEWCFSLTCGALFTFYLYHFSRPAAQTCRASYQSSLN